MLTCGALYGGSADWGSAMWIVLYVATIASLSALGLVPTLPVETDESPAPDSEM
jgi:hypothetical protein